MQFNNIDLNGKWLNVGIHHGARCAETQAPSYVYIGLMLHGSNTQTGEQ